MSQDGSATHKVRERAHRILRAWRARHVDVADTGEPLDLWGDGPAGVDKGLEALGDLTARKPCGRNLDELAILEREARGLRVEHHDVLLEQVEPMGPCPLGEALVVGADVLGRSREKQPLKGGCSSFGVLFSPACVGKGHV